MKEQIDVLRVVADSIDNHKKEVEKIDGVIRDLERVPEETILVELPGDLVLKTQRSGFHEDLPWDAYVLKDDKVFVWADGMTEIEALKKVLAKARVEGKLPVVAKTGETR